MKKAAQIIARTLEAGGVLSALEKLDNTGGLRVLTYHRVDEPSAEPDLDPGLISATPDEFREQMQLIAEHYHAVSLREVLAAHRGQSRLPRGAVLITFDDGYLDFAVHAWPVMRDLGLPAVLFVPTDFPDQVDGPGFWWDRLYAALRRAQGSVIHLPELGEFDLTEVTGLRVALKACKVHVKSLPHSEAMEWVEAALSALPSIPSLDRVIDWDTLRTLTREGLDVCVHGHLHALCDRLTAEELKNDLNTCRARLSSELGDEACDSVIAWPANGCSPQVWEIAQELGFELAFGGVRGVTRIPIPNALNVMRIPVFRYQRALFRAQMRPGIAGLGRWIMDKPWKAAIN